MLASCFGAAAAAMEAGVPGLTETGLMVLVGVGASAWSFGACAAMAFGKYNKGRGTS